MSHNYNSPNRFIDVAMKAGGIDVKIPEIKKVLTEATAVEYEDRETAHAGIREEVMSYYNENYPGIIESSPASLESSISSALNAFDENIFPYMKARWDVYPTFIGHMENDGCFRCHNGTHVNENAGKGMRVATWGALTVVWLLVGGCLALLLMERAIPEWLSHLTVSGVTAVVSVFATKRVLDKK